jgi:hypothetical protein
LRSAIALVGLLLWPAGSASKTVPESPKSPQIIQFVVEPRVIHSGETAVLRWSAQNASEVLLEEAVDPNARVRAFFHTIGKFPPDGTLEVRPAVSTTYVVSCGDERIGCSSASVHVKVK